VLHGIEPTASTWRNAASEPEVLMEGIKLGESPRWHDDQLWFGAGDLGYL
jgi:sugar lactone lactonase YvrE